MKYLQKLTEGVITLPPCHSLIRRPHVWDNDSVLIRFGQLQCEDQPGALLVRGAKELSINVMGLVQGVQLGRVIINRMECGTRRPSPEIEKDYFDFYNRYHLILQGLPGCMLSCGDETVNTQTGELWWFEYAAQHSIINNSKDDLIYMSVDIRIDP